MAVSEAKVYPRSGDTQTVYLKSVVTNPNIIVGDYTIYNDFVRDPRGFQENNVLYHYPVNRDRLVIGRFCSIACGAKFLFTSANHAMKSLSTYPFPIFFEEWGLNSADVASAWDNRGDIVIGSDVWIGYEAAVLSGVTIGDGAIIGARRGDKRRSALHDCGRRSGAAYPQTLRRGDHRAADGTEMVGVALRKNQGKPAGNSVRAYGRAEVDMIPLRALSASSAAYSSALSAGHTRPV